MDGVIANNLYGWFASLIRRHVRAVQSPEKNTATAEIPVPLAQTIGTAIKNDNKQRKSLSESGYETATSIIRININSRSISAKMDAEQKAASSNDDNTIEEDIEEVISENESSDENRLITSPVEIQNESMSNRLFGGETSGNFTINDDALSGNRIARDLQSEKMEELNQAASKRRDETFSQNTENDASELEESSNLFVRSLDMKSSLLNVDPRDCLSLDSDVRIIQPRASNSDLNDSYERDHSLEEITEANHSIEVFLDGKELSSMDANINIDSKPQFSRILEETTNSLQSQEQSESSQGNLGSESDKTLTGKLSGNHTNRTEKYETDEDDLNDLKNKILSCPTNNASAKGSNAVLVRDISFEQSELQTVVVKRMERVESEYSKEALDDITEESEKVSLQHAVDNDNTSNDFDSIISLNMIQMLENKVKDLQEIVAGKDVCLASLNMQLDSAQKREIFAASTENRDSLRDLPPSGRESSSLATTSSTEYRTLFDDIGPKVFDFHGELYQRNQLIEKLTESLQQSIEVREQLQMESERLSGEVQNLRKQLAETIEQFKKPFWPRDQESSTTGQRLSEISIDLVSESDEDLERQFLTDNEEKMSISNRNSKERQLNEVTGCLPAFDNFDPDPFGVSKQIEQFQKYLNPDEMRIFFMVQKKYDDFLSQEIEKVKMKNDSEMKIIIEQLENEKSEKDVEINRLRHLLTSVKNGSSDLDQLRKELETVHSLEMGKLRTYFEKKCADLEKHYSEEVFSQKSQRLSGETSASDVSDQEMMHDENVPPAVPKPHIVKKRSLEELFASPLHRQLTPTTLDCLENESDATIEELKNFYKDKFRETSQKYEDNIKRLKDRLRRFEAKYADDEFMKKSPIEHGIGDRPNLNFLNDTGDATSSSYLIIDQDELGLNESQEIRQIAAEYERRLQEQVALAKMDIVHELENQIQALVSETTTDDNHWPPELILIREKFTAKSQLEIAQLQIKHEEEMSRLKIDFEKQLNRKNKRNSTFDLSRDLDQIVSERDNLRELSSTFLYLLQELAKFVSICEDDLNSTIVDELQKHGFLGKPGDHNVSDGGDNEQSSGVLNISNQSNQDLQDKLSKTLRYVPDVSGLLSLIEDPTLIDFIADSNREGEFKLKECVEKLRLEANALLVLSEKIHQNREKQDEQSSEKQDSCEEEDGLKAAPNRTGKLNRANSLGENVVRDESLPAQMQLLSLPADIGRVEICTAHQLGKEEIFESNLSSSEVNVTLNELQNRLVKSETERLKLGEELQIAIGRNKELGIELYALRDQLKRLDQSQGEDLSEGYGLSEIQSPPRLKRDRNASTSFSQLQDKARNLLGTPTKNMSDNTSVLLQLIEQFCREGDKVMESGKRDRDDLQAQIDAADKKLKDTRQFLDIQAADREAERDEFLKEIEKLKLQIREKDKERCLFEIASKEFEQMEQQIRDLTQQVSKYESQKDKLEIELKASIDKIFVLREIITNLETQVDTKSLNENCLNEKVKELEAFIASQARSNETLQHEVESLKTEISQSYQERITQLEEQLRNTRSNSEQNIAIEQLAEQLRDIETTLDQKTKTLESLHAACSNSLSDNYSEELSAQNLPKDNNLTPQASPINTPRHHSLPIDEIQRVFQKLSKHTRVEEAAIKKIKEQEMLVANIRTAYGELENDGKLLQEKMTEQVVRISSLQSKLDEQRRRAEELNRQGTSDFAARIHDLQTEVYNLKETLSARDKQIVNLKNHLEQSKKIIDRQEAELAVTIQGDSGSVERLEAILRAKVEEIQMLKDKMKKEMINKLALPDLMETMLADKNEEIDNLKEQVKKLQNELQGILNIDLGKNESSSKEKEKSNDQGDGSKGSGRTLSDIVSISEYDEPDVIRRAITNVDTQLELPQSSMPDKTMNSSKCAVANLTEKRSGDVTLFDVPGNAHPMRTFDQPNFFLNTATSSKIGNNTTPSLIPRQINFSEFADGTKIKESTPKIIEVTGQAGEEVENLRKRLKSSEDRAESLKMSLETIENEKDAEIRRLVEELDTKTQIYNDLLKEKQELERKVESTAELHETLKAKAAVQDDLHEKIKEKSSRISELELILEQKTKENTELQANLTRKSDITTDSSEKILELNHNIDMLSNQLKQKDDTISKLQQNVINLQQNEVLQSERLNRIGQDKMLMQTELDMAREQLSEQVLVYQKTLLDMESISAKYEALHSELDVKEQRLSEAQLHLENTDEIFDLRKKIEDLTERNRALETDLERLRSQSGDSKPYSLDEIAEKVEKELNYSAQLDTNILKAIESEDENNLDAHLKRAEANEVPNTYLLDELNALKAQIESERKNSAQLMHQLNDVRFQTQDIQQQDADIIEAMRIRLEEAIEKETELHKILDEEREKCERLSSQVSVLQRTEARKSSFLNKTPPDSPRKAAKAAEDAEAVERLKEDIKLANSQNERERERVKDLEKALEREKCRFEKELVDRIEYGDKLKREMDKLKHEKDSADEEVEHLQDRLTSATHEIECLETRIATLQEAETRRVYRRGKERAETTQQTIEMQDLRNKLVQVESERDHLNEVIKLLREDVDRGAQREAKLAGALANSGSDNSIPEQFMQKLKEMSCQLNENAKENRLMAEKLQYLTVNKNTVGGSIPSYAVAEMEERANHLFGKYLRVESHRKALAHQKRYLMLILHTYQENEAKALNLLTDAAPRRKKRRSFKCVALAVLAIERMKFIVRRWHTGRIVVSKSIFNMVTQRRGSSNALAAANGSVPLKSGKHVLTSLSPPCRDRPVNERTPGLINLPLRPPLQAPGLISECTDKLDRGTRWK